MQKQTVMIDRYFSLPVIITAQLPAGWKLACSTVAPPAVLWTLHWPGSAAELSAAWRIGELSVCHYQAH